MNAGVAEYRRCGACNQNMETIKLGYLASQGCKKISPSEVSLLSLMQRASGPLCIINLTSATRLHQVSPLGQTYNVHGCGAPKVRSICTQDMFTSKSHL